MSSKDGRFSDDSVKLRYSGDDKEDKVMIYPFLFQCQAKMAGSVMTV